jgi:pseudomonalisin
VPARLKPFLTACTVVCAALPAYAAPERPASTPLVTAKVDDTVLTTLRGDHPQQAARAQDLGALSADTTLAHIMIGLKRPPALQAAFDKLVADQQRPGSPDYHAWLNPADLRKFAPAQADLAQVTGWLQSHGLTVNRITPSGTALDVAGRAGDFAAAFHVPVHRIQLGGETHLANLADAQIPTALTPVLAGVTFSNLFPKPAFHPSLPLFDIPPTSGFPAFQAVVPVDFQTIYNVGPLLNGSSLFGAPITGAGQTIAVIEQTDIKNKDWDHFRKYFGLSGYAGTFTQEHPGDCGDPGFTGDEVEAAIDAEWSSAPAPDAAIIGASCPGSETSFGVMTTLQNLVELGTPATIFSISYGGCELGDGVNFLQMWSNLIEEGASEGISIMVSSGDSGSSCDGNSIAENGVGVNGLASNPYDTAVGGTDFYDLALGEVNQYWSKHNKKSLGRSSALSYVPEIPWNNSCASNILANYAGKKNLIAYCNSNETASQNGVGGSGGVSVVYDKPDWQNVGVLGMPADGARDLPDVSLFAANGIWNHFYLICMSDENEGGYPCKYTGVNSQGVPNGLFQAYGGTSVSAPAFAGILALVSEVKGVRLGNPAPRLYQIAQAQYANSQLVGPCSATLGNKISAGCIFNDITAGNNSMPCAAGTPDCLTSKKSTQGIGILATATKAPAYNAQPGFSLATGLGSVNAENLTYNY